MMNKNLTIDVDGLKLIEESEGLRLTAYRDPIGILTIGYGHTGSDVYEGQVITQTEAEDLLKQDLSVAEGAVKQYVKVDITQREFDALVDFCFNCGIGNFRHSTLLTKINAGDFDGAEKEFIRWDRAGGKKLAGLTRRREAEAALFRKP